MWDKPSLLNWIANLLFAMSVVAMLYMALYVLVHLSVFPLREVKVEGQLSHVNHEQVKLIVDKHLKGNFFTLNLVEAKNAFEKLPWARKVSVRRRWPDHLDVMIEEHQPLARWGSIALVNTHGELFHAAVGHALPTFYGPGDGVIEVAEQYGEFNSILNPVHLNIENITLSPRRAWQVKTNNGMVIEVGRTEMQLRMKKFADIYRSTIVGLNKKISYADLRYPNGFAIKKPEEIAKVAAANSLDMPKKVTQKSVKLPNVNIFKH